MLVDALIADLNGRGIRLIPEPPALFAEPADLLTDSERQAIRDNKLALLARLCADLDRQRFKQDRAIRRGYDVDCSHPEHRAFLTRTGQQCACLESIGKTPCQCWRNSTRS